MASGALFGGTAARSSSKNLVEFRAGKMSMKGKMVHPDKRKGMVYVYQSDDSLMHFCWKDRTKGTVEDDLIIFPDDIEFKHVPQCTTGRVYLLKFKSSNRKFFFWMQEPKTDKDEEYRKKVNDLLNNPPTPGSSRGGSGGFSGLPPELASGGLAEGDLQSLLGNMNQQQLMQLLGGMGMSSMGGLSQLIGGRPGSAQSESTSRKVDDPPDDGGFDWRYCLYKMEAHADSYARPKAERDLTSVLSAVLASLRQGKANPGKPVQTSAIVGEAPGTLVEQESGGATGELGGEASRECNKVIDKSRDDQQKYVCSACPKAFQLRRKLRVHWESHHSASFVGYECPLASCSCSFHRLRGWSMRMHLRKAHSMSSKDVRKVMKGLQLKTVTNMKYDGNAGGIAPPSSLIAVLDTAVPKEVQTSETNPTNSIKGKKKKSKRKSKKDHGKCKESESQSAVELDELESASASAVASASNEQNQEHRRHSRKHSRRAKRCRSPSPEPGSDVAAAIMAVHNTYKLMLDSVTASLRRATEDLEHERDAWESDQNRYKERISELEKENSHLSHEVATLERRLKDRRIQEPPTKRRRRR